jgi:hypothetical protein
MWMKVGTVTGYPGVFQSNPCPYPSKPVPASMARVFVGTGRGFMKTHGFPNPCGFMPPEMTKEPRKSSASVNRHCRAALRGSEGWGNGNWGAEHAPQCECPVSCRGAVVVMVTGVQSMHPSVNAPFRVVGRLSFMGGWSGRSSLLVASCRCSCPFCVIICGCEGWAPLIFHGRSSFVGGAPHRW